MKKAKIVFTALIMVVSIVFGLGSQAFAAGNISRDDATAIALEHAGLTEDEITVKKLAAYNKKGTRLYDIEFVSESEKYSYKINAVSGEIIAVYLKKLNNKCESSSSISNESSAEIIDMETARQIAMDHAEVNESNISKIECKLKKNQYYDIEFVSDGMEYEYEIDAQTGAILSWECERD